MSLTITSLPLVDVPADETPEQYARVQELAEGFYYAWASSKGNTTVRWANAAAEPRAAFMSQARRFIAAHP